MEDSKLLRLATKLRPQLAEKTGKQWIRDYMEVITVLVSLPFVIVTLLWLTYLMDLTTIGNNQPFFLVLVVLLFFVQQQPFTIHLRVKGGAIPLVGSLANLVIWSALLLVGANALMIPLVSAVTHTIWNGWQQQRAGNKAFWSSFSFITQEIATSIFSGLIAITIYEAMGGDIPLIEHSSLDLMLALLAITIYAFLPGFILLPIIIQLNRLTGSSNSPVTIANIFVGVAILTLFVAPFALPASLLYTASGYGLFLFFMVGVFLVNFLANYLSLTDSRSHQRSRELAQLSQLGDAIIQAPSDGSTLAQMLDNQMEDMFPDDIIVINLDSPHDEKEKKYSIGPDFVWPSFQITYPPKSFVVGEEIWNELFTIDRPYLTLRNVTMPGKKIAYGDAIAVKILVTIYHAEQDKRKETACVGGILLLRNKAQGNIEVSLSAVQSLSTHISSALFSAQVYAALLAAQRKREQQLQATVSRLRIEIDSQRKQKQLKEIIETDYFKYLELNAEILRDNLKRNRG